MGDNGFHEFVKATFLPTFGNPNASAVVEVGTQAPSATEPAESGASELTWAKARIAVLESTLLLLVHFVDESRSDSEGHYPALVSSCIECTCGATPNKYNKGLCPYHLAKQVLKNG